MTYRPIVLVFIAASIMIGCTAARVGAGTTGVISGIAKDAVDGTPLSGANIIVKGTNLTTVTDANGRFVIINVPPGDYEVSAEMVGYAVQTQGAVQVTMDVTAQVAFDMSKEAIQEEAVVVTRPRPMINPDTINTLNLVTPEQEALARLDTASIRTAPGVLSSLPGVTVNPDGSGQMHMRGGRTDQIGWYIEGIPITDPNTGMFGTNLFTTGTDKFQAYTGGFGAEYGNAISGVLNEVKRTGPGYPGLSSNLEYGDTNYRDAFLQLGGGSSETFSYYVGSALQRTGLDGPIVKLQEYADNVVKMVLPSGDSSLMVLAAQGSLLGQLDNYHTTGDNDLPTPLERDYMRQRYGIGAVRWSHNYSARSSISLSPYYMFTGIVQNTVGGSISFATPNFLDAWSARRGFQARYTSQLNDRHLLSVGGSVLDSKNNYYLFFPGFPFFRADVNTFQSDLFAQDEIKLSDKWTAQAGARFESITYDRGGQAYVSGSGYSGAAIPDVTESGIEPRLGLSFAPNDRAAWKLSWGQYRKFVPASAVQKTYFAPDTDFGGITLEELYPGIGSTEPQESTAAEISYEKQVSDTTAFRITPFYAKYENLGDDYLDPGTGVTQYANLGEGRSSGVELYLRKKMSNNWQGWLSYTYAKTKSNRANLGLTDQEYYTSWDQRHTLTLVADYKNGQWGHNLRADYGSGMADIGDPTLQERAKPRFILSYGLTMDLPKESNLGDQVYLSVYNLLNNKQALQYRWDAGPTRVKDSWVPSRFLSIGISRAY